MAKDRWAEKAVNRMLDRRARTLFGRPYSECSELQRDVCLLWLNLSFSDQGLDMKVTKNPVQPGTSGS